MQKFKSFFISTLAIYSITLIFLSIQSLGNSNTLTFASLVTATGLDLFLSYFTLINFINVLFIVSLLFFCLYGFKWLTDKGAYDTIHYSWQKNKRHVLFFLPKYWGTSTKEVTNKDEDIDDETGEKIYHNYEDFIDFKRSRNWISINQLFLSAIGGVIISFVLTLFVS